MTRRLVAACLLFALLAGQFALARYPTRETGWLTAVIGGQEYRSYTLATEIPADVAEGVPAGEERDMLERIAGTEQHTAYWSVAEPVVTAGVELLGERIRVSVTTRTGHPDGSGVNSFVLRFALAPVTLELLPEAGVEVTFYPSGQNGSDYWTLADGSLQVGPVTVLDAHTLSLEGSFSGVLKRHPGTEGTEAAPETQQVSATFTLEQVGSNSPVPETLPGR